MSFTVRRLKETPTKNRLPWRKTIFAVSAVVGSAFGIRTLLQRRKQSAEEKRLTLLKRFFMVLVAVLAAAVVLVGIFKVLAAMHIVNLSSVASIAGTPPVTDARGHINLLLLGQGDANHDGTDLTDTVMVVSIDPDDTKSALMISLPRDLYFLKTDNMGKGRINSLYRDYKSYLRFRQGLSTEEAAMQAMEELAAEVGRSLGMEIPYVVKVDFAGFVAIVDELGGIDMDVPEAITDTEYPDGNWGYQTFSIGAGQQTLDGDTALKYARSRSTSSDFDRSARQQMVLRALAEKAKADGVIKDPSKISALVRLLSDYVSTNMSLRVMIGLADIAREIEPDPSRMVSVQINDRNGLYDTLAEKGGLLYAPPRNLFDGASVLLPVSIPEFPITWRQIQGLVTLLQETRAVYLQDPVINLLNAGAKSGSARKLATELTRYAFSVDAIENADREEDLATSVVLYREEADKPLAEFFGTLMQMEVTTNASGATVVPNEQLSRVTIVIGEDYDYQPLQNLLPQPDVTEESTE